jgi:hypothetical protein
MRYPCCDDTDPPSARTLHPFGRNRKDGPARPERKPKTRRIQHKAEALHKDNRPLISRLRRQLPREGEAVQTVGIRKGFCLQLSGRESCAKRTGDRLSLYAIAL